MGRLCFRDMLLGKIDAYNEFLEYGADVCKNTFLEYPNLDINDLLNGSIYYIFGDKGTGKTMLLKYIEYNISTKGEKFLTEFVRFKKDVDEDQRNQIKRVSIPSQPFEEILDKDIPTDSNIDCSLAWQIYLIKLIVFRVAAGEERIFDQTTKTWKNLLGLIKALYPESPDFGGVKSSIKKILPKVKKGNVELKLGPIKLDFDLEWNDDTKTTISFSYIARKIIELFENLTPIDGGIYILIDELELSLKKTKQYERDITLIRDLIFAIKDLQEIIKTNHFHVYIISAIRNEIYRHILTKGMEINKAVHDYGAQISWVQKGGDVNETPLLKMLAKKIKYSEEKKGLMPTEDIWKDYFAEEICKSIPQTFILRQTWNRPRDIVRLFNIVQSVQGQKTIFDQETFERVQRRYSEESWYEFEETLTATYSNEEVAGIKQVLTGISLPFSLREFSKRIIEKAQYFSEVEKLNTGKHSPSEILRDLYDLGIVGNYTSNPRFVFLGDIDIDPLSDLTIHYPLMRFFGASFKKYENKNKPNY